MRDTEMINSFTIDLFWSHDYSGQGRDKGMTELEKGRVKRPTKEAKAEAEAYIPWQTEYKTVRAELLK